MHRRNRNTQILERARGYIYVAAIGMFMLDGTNVMHLLCKNRIYIGQMNE